MPTLRPGGVLSRVLGCCPGPVRAEGPTGCTCPSVPLGHGPQSVSGAVPRGGWSQPGGPGPPSAPQLHGRSLRPHNSESTCPYPAPKGRPESSTNLSCRLRRYGEAPWQPPAREPIRGQKVPLSPPSARATWPDRPGWSEGGASAPPHRPTRVSLPPTGPQGLLTCWDPIEDKREGKTMRPPHPTPDFWEGPSK